MNEWMNEWTKMRLRIEKKKMKKHLIIYANKESMDGKSKDEPHLVGSYLASSLWSRSRDTKRHEYYN